jgi:chromosome segregation ATPase
MMCKMTTGDLTLEVLKSIRDEVRQTNGRLDQTNARLDQTNERLDGLREELSRRIVESEVRTSTAIGDLAGTVREMTALLRNLVDLRPRVERCEQEIDALKQRLPPAPH